MICILLSLDYMKKEKFFFYEFFIILKLSILGMCLLVSAFDFISFYLSLELQSLSFYILASFKRNSNFSTEAGLKYFILGSLASCLILFGVSIIYGFTGITCFDDFIVLNNLIKDPFYFFIFDKELNGFFIGLLLVFIGLLFKLGAGPFHFWVPDVYEGVPLIVTTFFAIVPKIVITSFILIFFCSYFYSFEIFWHQWFIFTSIFSFFIGSLGAIYQVKIKRLLAYSAIGHVGFLSLGLSLNTVEGFQGIILYLMIYVSLSVITFSLFLSLRRFNNNLKFKNILDLKNLFKINPLFSFFFCLTFFSIAGIPPLMGFFSKFYIFLASLKEGFFFITLFSLFLSVVSSFYYIRLIKLVFFEKTNSWTFLKPLNKINSFLIVFLSFFNLFFFVYPEIFLGLSYKLSIFLFL